MTMKRVGCIALILLVLALSAAAGPRKASAEPPYAKWGRMAMKETTERYHAPIVDYKHLGRQAEQAGVVSESFKLILSRNGQQFGVTVRIWFEQQSERVIRIQFTEEGRAASKTNSHYKMI